MIVTTNLAKGAVTMARRKTIVKRLNAIQNFGAMDVLCTDKTGTLTQDKIVLERHVNVVGEEDECVLSLAYINSFYQTGLKNLLDVAVLEHGELQNASWRSTTRTAKVDEIPFDFTRRRMSVVVDQRSRSPPAHLQGRGRGGPRRLQARARRGSRRRELDSSERRDDAQGAGRGTERGRLPRRGGRVSRLRQDATAPYTVADESELTLAGFIGFLDPPKETAAPALQGAQRRTGSR